MQGDLDRVSKGLGLCLVRNSDQIYHKGRPQVVTSVELAYASGAWPRVCLAYLLSILGTYSKVSHR